MKKLLTFLFILSLIFTVSSCIFFTPSKVSEPNVALDVTITELSIDFDTEDNVITETNLVEIDTNVTTSEVDIFTETNAAETITPETEDTRVPETTATPETTDVANVTKAEVVTTKAPETTKVTEATTAPESVKLTIPTEPKRTSNVAAYYSLNGTNPYGECSDDYDGLGPTSAKKSVGEVNGIGAMGLLGESGGYLVIPGKAWIGKDGFTLPHTGGAIVITGKDPVNGTSYLGSIETDTGANGTQTGMFMIKDNCSLNFAGDYIFENTIILHRAPSSTMRFNVVSGGKLVIDASVRIERMTISATAPIATASINVDGGAYLYLHTIGFSAYTGEGTIVIDRALIDSGKANKSTFAGFAGKVVDENGYLLYEGNASALKELCPKHASLGEHSCVLASSEAGTWTIGSYQGYGTRMNYKIYLPQNYDAQKKYPFVIYMHGASGESINVADIGVHSILKKALNQSGGDAILLIPQCPDLEYWPFAEYTRELAFELINHIAQHSAADPDRIYLTGHSYGSIGSLYILEKHPDYFAAAILTGGASSYSNYYAIATTPIRMYCGGNDGFLTSMQSCRDTLKAHGADVELTVFEGKGHDIFNYTGNNTNAVEWMLAQRAD